MTSDQDQQEPAAEPVTLTVEQWDTLKALADYSEDDAVPAVDDVLKALARKLGAEARSPGMSMVDDETLRELQALASDGQKWQHRVKLDHAESTVDDAIKRSKISPAARGRWVNYMMSDPEDAGARLASIADNTIPTIELGHSMVPDDMTDEPRWVR